MESSEKAKKFGLYLRSLRNKNNMTLKQLSEATNLTIGHLSNIENGRRGIPSPELLRKLAGPLRESPLNLMAQAGHLTFNESDREKIRDTLDKIKVTEYKRLPIPIIGNLSMIVTDLLKEIEASNPKEEKDLDEFSRLFYLFLNEEPVSYEDMILLLPDYPTHPSANEVTNIIFILEAIKYVFDSEIELKRLAGELEATTEVVSLFSTSRVLYNGHELNQEDRRQALDMLRVLFRKYEDD